MLTENFHVNKANKADYKQYIQYHFTFIVF